MWWWAINFIDKIKIFMRAHRLSLFCGQKVALLSQSEKAAERKSDTYVAIEAMFRLSAKHQRGN